MKPSQQELDFDHVDDAGLEAEIISRLRARKAALTPENIEAAMADIIREQNEQQDERRVPVGTEDDDLGPAGTV